MPTELHWHPAAEAFPMLDGDAFQAFVDDVRANGLRHPIEIYRGQRWPEFAGFGLDGRNRLAACRAAGVTPRFVELGDAEVGDSLTSYIASANVVRRQLSSSQAAFVAVELKKVFEVEAKKRQSEGAKKGGEVSGAVRSGNLTQKIEEGSMPEESRKTNRHESAQKAADMVGSNRQYVYDAEAIARESPALAEQVRAGLLSIPNAKWAIKKRQDLPDAFASLEAGDFNFEQFRLLCTAVGDTGDTGDGGDSGDRGDGPLAGTDEDAAPPPRAEKSDPAERPPSRREAIQNVFADLPELRSIIAGVGALKERILQAARRWSGAWLDMRAAFSHLDSVCAILHAGAPRALCPSCGGEPQVPPKFCHTCQSMGFIGAEGFRQLTPELQAQASQERRAK
jgi:hypothetical protein